MLYVVALYLGRATRPEGGEVALAWPAAGAGVWFLAWAKGRTELVSATLSILAVGLYVNVDTGLPLVASAAFAVVNVGHAVVGMLLLHGLVPVGRGLREPGDVLRLLLVALGAGAASGLGSAVVAAGLLDQPFWDALLLLVVRNGGTTFVVLAGVLSLSDPHRVSDLVSSHQVVEVILGAAASLGVYLLVFFWNPGHLPILFLALSISVWAGTRLGVPRTGALSLVLCTVAVWSTVTDHGTLSGVEAEHLRAVLGQAYTVLVLVVGLSLATLQRSKREVSASLAASLAQLQHVGDSALISTAVVVKGADGGWSLTEPNPALVRLLGRDPSGMGWSDLLHPDDSPVVRAAIDAIAGGDGVGWEGEVRHSQPRGGWLWTELHVASLPGIDGTTAVVAQMLDITGRRASQDELLRLAHHDSLTGLPNRSRIHAELDRLLQEPSGAGVAVLFLDLDHFKSVNDTYGHAAGDRVLVQVAQALEEALRPGDLVSRLGGDEFVVCCPGVVDLEHAQRLVRRMADAVRPALRLDGVDVGLDVSIGVSLSDGEQDATQVLRRSDEAMYEIKRRGRSLFEEASTLVLDYLRRTLPLSFWAVTRVENGRQTYLHLEDNGYGLQRGGSHPWEASYCIHMAAGRTPAIAPDAQAVPQYAAAAVNEAVTIGTYAGAPIHEPDGTLFGAICGLDPQRRTDDAALAAAGPVLQLLGQLLSMALSTERQRAQHSAALLAERVKGETDQLTGLLNWRAWERTIEDEAKRFASFADPTVIAILDLDILKDVNDRLGHQVGDDYFRRAGHALLSAVREGDEVARLGGDEFGILLRGCTEAAAAETVARIYTCLEKEKVAGFVGWAPISVLRGLPAAIAEADQAMHAAKTTRREQQRQVAAGIG
ncbi:MAG: diguanylate cyclase domain-containing protein [Cellulomonas sp.]